MKSVSLKQRQLAINSMILSSLYDDVDYWREQISDSAERGSTHEVHLFVSWLRRDRKKIKMLAEIQRMLKVETRR